MKDNSIIHTRESDNRKVIVETYNSQDRSRRTFRINKYQRPAHGARLISLPPEYESDQEKAIEKANEWVK